MSDSTAPGPQGGLAPVRNLLAWRRDPARLLIGAAKSYGGVVRMMIGPYLKHLVTAPEAVQQVLVTNNHNYRRGPGYEQFKLVMGNGLLTADGAYWRTHRRTVQPLFHHKAVTSNVPLVVRTTGEMLDRWERYARRDEPVDLVAEMTRLTMVTMGRALLGYDVGEMVPRLNRAVSISLELMFTHGVISERLPRWVPVTRNRQIRHVQALSDEFIRTVRAHHAETGDGPLIGLMESATHPDTGRHWTAQEIRDELVTIYMAGHETTAIAGAWTLQAVATRPEVVRALNDEVERVLAGREPLEADVGELAFTGNVVYEALRLYPPIWIYPRGAIEDDTVLGYRIPAGSLVVLSPLISHRNPDIWKDPDEFDPDRFAGEALGRLPRISYYPFGGGPRLCVGNLWALVELKIILAMVLQRFDLEALWSDEVSYGDSMISLRPRSRLLARLRSRSGAKASAGARA